MIQFSFKLKQIGTNKQLENSLDRVILKKKPKKRVTVV